MPDELSPAALAALTGELATGGGGRGGGVAVAATATMAASLVTLVARASLGSWEDAGGVAAQATVAGDRARELADAGAGAFAVALAALRPPDGRAAGDALGPPLLAAVDAPLRLAALAADVAAMAFEAARHGDPDRRPDAAVAAVLAEGAARAATLLVEVNLAIMPGDPRVARSRRELAAATASRAAAVALLA